MGKLTLSYMKWGLQFLCHKATWPKDSFNLHFISSRKRFPLGYGQEKNVGVFQTKWSLIQNYIKLRSISIKEITSGRTVSLTRSLCTNTSVLWKKLVLWHMGRSKGGSVLQALWVLNQWHSANNPLSIKISFSTQAVSKKKHKIFWVLGD